MPDRTVQCARLSHHRPTFDSRFPCVVKFRQEKTLDKVRERLWF